MVGRFRIMGKKCKNCKEEHLEKHKDWMGAKSSLMRLTTGLCIGERSDGIGCLNVVGTRIHLFFQKPNVNNLVSAPFPSHRSALQ